MKIVGIYLQRQHLQLDEFRFYKMIRIAELSHVPGVMLCHLKYKCDFLLNIHTNIVPGNNAGNRINSYMKICVIRIDHVSIIVLDFNELKQEPCVCTVEATPCDINNGRASCRERLSQHVKIKVGAE